MGKNELKKFGLILGTVLAAWGAWWLKNGSSISIVFLIISLLILLMVLFRPVALKPVFSTSTALGRVLGWLSTRLILLFIFYIIIMPIGLWLRLSKKDLLGLKPQSETNSYWRPHQARFDKSQLTKQY
jgi:hypothetical protein